MWVTEEEEVLKTYFNMTKTPTLEECQLFLKDNTDGNLFANRTAKETQDKCRTIIRKGSKN